MAAAAEAAAGAVADTAHKVKLINFKGRRVPILLQVSCRGQKTAWRGAARMLLRLLEAPAATPPTCCLRLQPWKVPSTGACLPTPVHP